MSNGPENPETTAEWEAAKLEPRMSVYVVMAEEYVDWGEIIVGVYSTEEAATTAADTTLAIWEHGRAQVSLCELDTNRARVAYSIEARS